MKRMCLVLVVLMLCAATVFAGGKREEGVTTLTIAGRDGAFGTAMELATQEYTRQNPNVRFEILKLSGAELMEQTVIELRGGTGAFDVLLVDDPFLPRIQEAGWLVNLDTLYREKGLEIDPDLVENMVNVGRYPHPSGDLYALPHVGNVALFAYRHDIAARYGYSAIDTWSDVLDIAQRVAAEGDDTVPVLFRGVQGNPIVTGFLPLFWAFGADILVDGKPAFDTPEALAAVEFFLELAEYAPAGVTAYQSTQVRDALMSGAGAMAIEVWPGWIGDLENPEQSNVVGQVSIAAHPGQVKGSSSMIGAWMVGIPRDSRNIDAAFDFIQYLTSAPVQEMMADETGIPPTRHSVHHISRLQEKYPWYPAQLAGQISGSVRPRTDYWPQIETTFGDYLQRALVGEVSAEEALQQIQRRVTEILR